MRAIVQTRYGSPDVLELREVDVPGIRADEVLVRVHAASVHPDVWHMLRGQPHVLRVFGNGLRRPARPVPGTDLAGTVVAAGREAGFRPGDQVYGETIRGYQWRNGGAFAEYAAAPASALAPKPAALSFVEAGVVPTSGLIALQSVHAGQVSASRRVLVNGAAGGVGLFAVQLAKALGAEVTGVDVGGKLELVAAFADRALDGNREDFTRERYDVIVDVPFNRPYADIRRALTADGTYVIVAHDGYGAAGRRLGSIPRVLRLMARSPFDDHLPGLEASAPDKAAGLAELSRLIEAGQLRPVVDRTYPLEQVADAIRHLETGSAQGKVAIAVRDDRAAA